MFYENNPSSRAGWVSRGQLKVHNSKSGTCQGGVFLVYCTIYFIILIYLTMLQFSRGASGKEFFGARTHGFCTHQARPTCKNTGKVNNRSRETGTHRRHDRERRRQEPLLERGALKVPAHIKRCAPAPLHLPHCCA